MSLEALLEKALSEAWAGCRRNCGALALAALDVVAQQTPPVQASIVELSIDHEFTVIGTMTPELLLKPFREWPSHLHVCDPWANICCPVPEYPEHFEKKMAKWSDGRKLILVEEGTWDLPSRCPRWMQGAHQAAAIKVEQRDEQGRRTMPRYVHRTEQGGTPV